MLTGLTWTEECEVFRGELQEMLTCSTTMYRTEAIQMHAMHTNQYPIRRAKFLKS